MDAAHPQKFSKVAVYDPSCCSNAYLNKKKYENSSTTKLLSSATRRQTNTTNKECPWQTW